MVPVGEETWGSAWPTLYGTLGSNPWAAMPSLHFAASAMAAILLSEAGPAAGAAGWGYALTLGFALVYLGEHYVTDLAAGAALVAAVRRGEPLAEPLVLRINRGLRRMERLANEDDRPANRARLDDTRGLRISASSVARVQKHATLPASLICLATCAPVARGRQADHLASRRCLGSTRRTATAPSSCRCSRHDGWSRPSCSSLRC